MVRGLNVAGPACLSATYEAHGEIPSNAYTQGCPEAAGHLYISMLKKQSTEWEIIFKNFKKDNYPKYARNSGNSVTEEQCGLKTGEELV